MFIGITKQYNIMVGLLSKNLVTPEVYEESFIGREFWWNTESFAS